MLKSLIIAMALLCLVVPTATAQIIPTDMQIGNGWSVDIDASLPVAMVMESPDGGSSLVDVRPLIALGAGLSWYYFSPQNPEHEKIVSINFPVIALSTRIDDPKTLDFMIIFDVGLFDNKVRFGGGWWGGNIDYDRTRFCGVFSLGTNIF